MNDFVVVTGFMAEMSFNSHLRRASTMSQGGRGDWVWVGHGPCLHCHQGKKGFWTTLCHLRRETQCTVSLSAPCMVAVVHCWPQLVNTWKDHLNPTGMSSSDEAELGKFRCGLSYLLILKALDVVGMSWLTWLFSIVYDIGGCASGLSAPWGFPLFKKGDQRACSNIGGSHSSAW